MPEQPRRKFQINPGPLKVVPAERRRPFAKEGDFANLGRCDALTRDGLRCPFDGKVEVDGCWLCGIHARRAPNG